MKLHTLALALLLLSSGNSYGQYYGFGEGEITTNSMDTISVLVELSPSYGSSIAYKASENAPEKSMKVREIVSLRTPYNNYETVMVKKRAQLFRIMVQDSISLLQHVQINTGVSEEEAGGSMALYSAPTITYAIQVGHETYIIKKKKDLEKLEPLFFTREQLWKQINSKHFKLEELEGVVAQLNKP